MTGVFLTWEGEEPKAEWWGYGHGQQVSLVPPTTPYHPPIHTHPPTTPPTPRSCRCPCGAAP
jgi:hypothetical protein